MRIHEVKTPAVRLAYEDSGPKKGERILLVHGWPDSPRTWDKVLPALHDAGYRTIVPYLRGYGPSTYRDSWFGKKTRRTGQPVAFAQDMIDLADDLGMRSFHFIGHDWGARTAHALSALFPERLKSMVTIAVPFAPASTEVPAFPQAKAYWYQWLLCTEPGAKKFREDPVAFGKAQWDTWSPQGWYTPGEFAETARSWSGKDFEDTVLHSYRSRWGEAEKDPRYGVLQTRLEATAQLTTPTLLIHGMDDTCGLPESTDGAGRYFTNGYRRVLVEDAGHFVQREKPKETAAAILEHLREYAAPDGKE